MPIERRAILAFASWWTRDARWWQVWRPMSGPVGGCAAGVAIYFAITFMMRLL